jgi:hypothetical protein
VRSACFANAIAWSTNRDAYFQEKCLEAELLVDDRASKAEVYRRQKAEYEKGVSSSGDVKVRDHPIYQ